MVERIDCRSSDNALEDLKTCARGKTTSSHTFFNFVYSSVAVSPSLTQHVNAQQKLGLQKVC